MSTFNEHTNKAHEYLQRREAKEQPRLIYAGCDLGISSAKVVITENRTILACEIVPYKNFPLKATATAMEGALRKAGLPEDRIVSCMATGFGQKIVPFANQTAPDPTCLLRALRELNPQVRTVIDVGGHTLMASNIDRNWKLVGPAIIENCVAGTGLFIEVMAKALEFPMEELAIGSLASENPIQMTNTCVVFAESEVISRINEGYSRFDVFAGIALSTAAKIASMAKRVDILPKVAMTGGVAKNAVVTREVERQFGLKLADLRGIDPQIVAAFGAALLAEENDLGGTKPGVDER